MPEEATSQTAPATGQPNVELAQMMNFALSDKAKPEDAAQQQTQQEAAQTVNLEPPPFSFETLKEKFQYEKPEDVVAEIEQLRAFKNAPLKTEEIKFENEQSKKLFDAIKAGKSREVADILAQQERLETITSADVTKDNAAEIIKMGMQVRYKELTPAQIEYKFNKQFAIPKEPVQGDMEDDDFAIAKREWAEKVAEVEMEREIEAKLLKPELEAQKSKLVLPEIKQEPDEAYLQYKKNLEEEAVSNELVIKEYQSFTPDSIATKINFKDEANKIDFNFEYVPSVEKFAGSKDMLVDINKFFALFSNQDGTPDRVSFAKAVHFATNYEEILVEAMKQSKNATLKSILPDNSGGQRFGTDFKEPSELEKQMQRALN